VSTWQDGNSPPSSQYFSQFLSEAANDFRVGSLALSNCKFAIFGVGSASYGDTFNAAARDFSKWLRALGAKELLPICEGDVDTGDLDMVFNAWGVKVVKVLKGEVEEESYTNGFDEEFDEMDELDEIEEVGSAEVDIEDIAGKAPDKNSVQGLHKNVLNGQNGVKEMVTPIIRSSLEKQVSLHSFCFPLSDFFFSKLLFPNKIG
jgi:tRNA wybutosine-synthesizing protein 1